MILKIIPIRVEVLLIIGIATILMLAFIGELSFPDSSQNFLGTTKRAELSDGKPITQEFQIDQNGLEGFQIFMGDTELGFGERINFTLLDSSCQTILYQSSRTMFSLPVTRDIRFTFPTIARSENETYCLSIEYHPGLVKKKDRPYVRVTENSSLQDISYTDHGKGKTYYGRTLQIRPLYAPALGNTTTRIETLENRLSQYKPAFAKGLVLPLGILGLILGMAFFIWITRQEN